MKIETSDEIELIEQAYTKITAKITEERQIVVMKTKINENKKIITEKIK